MWRHKIRFSMYTHTIHIYTVPRLLLEDFNTIKQMVQLHKYIKHIVGEVFCYYLIHIAISSYYIRRCRIFHIYIEEYG